MTTALAAGGIEHFGWGVDRHMDADLYDALNANTRATGNWGKKGPPKIPNRPRPKFKPQLKQSDGDTTPKPKVSVKSLHASMSRR